MKARLEQLTHHQKNQSFYCYEVIAPEFEFKWHYHPEYELTYIEKGCGKRLVGDSYENFEDGDLVLLGPNLPHTWVGDKIAGQISKATVIQFTAEFLSPLLQYQEMAEIRKLITKSGRGLRFNTQRDREIIAQMVNIRQLNGVEAFTLLLNILQKLSEKKYTPLSSAHYKPLKGTENQQRINAVFDYIRHAYQEKISLQKAAELLHLSESAFCKFIKRVSGKTFSALVNEIRLTGACQLLIETDLPISQIAFESGFESLSYFNRVFLRNKKVRPGEFRRRQ